MTARMTAAGPRRVTTHGVKLEFRWNDGQVHLSAQDQENQPVPIRIMPGLEQPSNVTFFGDVGIATSVCDGTLLVCEIDQVVITT